MTMLSIYLFLFILCGALSENINCQFKPGCDANHCDPSPLSWNKPGFNIDEYLHKKQFPITCEAKKEKSSDDVLRLYAENAENRQEIKDLKQDVRNLVREVSALKEKNKNAENVFTEVRNLVQEVSALKEKNNIAENGAVTDIQDLLKKFSVLEAKNEKAENEINKLQKKFDVMEATGTTNEPATTRGAVTTSETTTPETNADSLWFGGKQYIALVSAKVNKSTAEAKCHNIGGKLANFYNTAHMNTITNYVRQNKLDGSNFRWFHLGMTYDPTNQILRLRNGTQVSISDHKWFPGSPYNGQFYASYTNVFIVVDGDPSDADQYLLNNPDSNRYVLCEI